MKPARRPRLTAAARELGALQTRLAESEETLRAIRSGEVDAVVVAGKQGRQVFTLQGADHAYRELIESMNEGALTLAADTTILYANQCFARMVKRPLAQVVGNSLRSFLSEPYRIVLRQLLIRTDKSGAKLQLKLKTGDGSLLPVQISVRTVAGNRSGGAIFGMVVTDMTEARHNEEMLRALSHRLVQTQEAERGRVALELHDHITQLLCAVIFRSQALAEKLSAHDGPLKTEATKLREMLGTTTEEVERISRGLRPSVLDQLGLDSVLRDTAREFTHRTGLPVTVTYDAMAARLPADTELALYRILQQALNNVEKHARARHVTVELKRVGARVHLTVQDDGRGFKPVPRKSGHDGVNGVGLFDMRERAAHLGGTLRISSGHRTGTAVAVSIPIPNGATAPAAHEA